LLFVVTPSNAQDIGDASGRSLDAATQGVGLEPVLQPIVALSDGAVVGYEALARWPTLDNPSPVDVFCHASAAGRVDGLNQLCIHAAIRAARQLHVPRGTLLAINTEPASSYAGCSGDDALARARDELALMFEITERGLLDHPRKLLTNVAAMRRDGVAVALDDLGAHPDSLALLDIIAPDVIKLDVRLVQSQPDRHQARTLAAILAHHERTGATILAEGIETDEHLEQALAVGASLGQGRKYSYPRPEQSVGAWTPPTPSVPSQLRSASPFDLLVGVPLRTARKKTLTAFSRHIEEQASHSADPPMVLTALQHRQYFTPATRRRYLQLARSSPLIAVFGQHLPPDLGADVRGVHLDSADPLRTEWTVLALGAQIAVALIAREHVDHNDQPQPDNDRHFDFTITYDRRLVTAVAHNLLARME